MNKIVAISDIHGHYDQLIELYDKLIEKGIDPAHDTFVFLGDYVDGGPRTKEVLDLLRLWQELRPHWKFLMGNHEGMLLDALPQHSRELYYLWYEQGGKATLESFKRWVEEPDPVQRAMMSAKDLISSGYTKFLRNLDPYYETDKYFFVHAGVDPTLSLEEVKEMCAGPNAEGMKYELMWIRDAFFTSTKDWGKKIIFGHTTWPDFQPMIKENMIGLDTMMHNTGRLTAIILPDEEIVQTDMIHD